MSKIFNLFSLSIILAIIAILNNPFETNCFGQNSEREVTINSINIEKRIVEVEFDTPNGIVTKLWEIEKNAKIKSNGKDTDLGDLKAGQTAKVYFNTSIEKITLIDAGKIINQFVKLFDGKTLNGWKGDPNVWQVKDGVLNGKNFQKKESFLRTKNTFEDFVLRLKFRYLKGNSGVNIRSYTKEGDVLSGPQIEITDTKLPVRHIVHGVIFDSHGSGKLSKDLSADVKEKILASVKNNWSLMEITVRANKLTVKINSLILHNDLELKEMSPSGIIGFQAQGPTEVEFKDIEIRELK